MTRKDKRRGPFSAGPALLGLALLAGLACAGAAKQEKPPEKKARGEKPSVLLITLDTTRADRLGCYGSAEGLTPFLDDFAKRSALFEKCESAVPLTLPSHATIMSGCLPLRHGVRVNVETAVPKDVPLLAEEFGRAGYQTAAFVSASVLLKRYGLDRGFGAYDDSFYDTLKKGHQKADAGQTLPKALAWLKGQKGPFFCWVHLFDPHVPYAAPEPFGSKYKEHPYDGEIAYMDAQLQAFWQALSQSLDADGLLVVFCADHGEALGEHGELDHGIFLYQNTMHVPLLVRLPRQKAPRPIEALVGLVDVAPTIRDLAGLAPAPVSDGRSLAPLLDGGALEPRDVFMESMEGLLTYGWAPLYGLAGGHEKYIQAPKPELYDLAADPGEASNLVAARPGEAEALKKKIQAVQGAIKTLAPERPKGSVTDEEMKRLASLGYLGGTFSPSASTDKDPKDYIALQKPIIEASLLLRERKYGKALAILQKISSQDPSNPFILFLTGQAYSGSNPDKAIAAWKRAVQIDPSYHMAWTEWVVMLLNQGKNDEGARVAEVGLSSCQDRLGVLNLALAEKAFLDAGPDAGVLEGIGKALAMNPDLARAYLLRGEVRLRACQAKEAEADLQTVWQHATVEEVDRWQKDRAFIAVFKARGKGPK